MPNKIKEIRPVCFWCMAPFEPAIELGDDFTDEEKLAIPDECILNYDPCPDCMASWLNGRVFIEYDDTPHEDLQVPLSKSNGTQFYPTGRHVVLPVEKAEAMFGINGAEIEPISFLERENFLTAFEREPEEICFWCGGSKDGEKNSEKHLKHVSDYDFCQNCVEKYAGKTVVLECAYTSKKALSGVYVKVDGENMSPTGRLMRLETTDAKRILGEEIPDSVFVTSEKFKILTGETKSESGKKVEIIGQISAPKGGILQRSDGEDF